MLYGIREVDLLSDLKHCLSAKFLILRLPLLTALPWATQYLQNLPFSSSSDDDDDKSFMGLIPNFAILSDMRLDTLSGFGDSDSLGTIGPSMLDVSEMCKVAEESRRRFD